MNIAIIGNGARENAIKENLQHHYASICDSSTSLFGFDIVVPSMEKDLVNGTFHNRGLNVFGPSEDAARIEGSKIFSKTFMTNYNIPTPEFKAAMNLDYAKSILKKDQVIKLDGLAGGKGVFLYDSLEEGYQILENIYNANYKEKIIIEERIYGTEVSVMAFCNGKTLELMPQIMDYKQVYKGGKNTGGMGAIGPVNVLTKEEMREVKEHMQTVVEKLKFIGVLYAGIIKNHRGFYFLEFNCRFGDPETQVALNLLDSDLYHVMYSCVMGKEINVKWKKKFCANVVLSHEDYPERKLFQGVPIKVDELDPDIKIYWANNHDGYTTGGRVASIVHLSDDLSYSLNKIYNNIHKITYQGVYYRRDIGYDYLLRNRAEKKLKLAVLSSSRGTSLSKLIRHDMIEVIVSDKNNGVVVKGMANNIKSLYIPKIDYEQLINILDDLEIDLIYAVGFMQIIPKFFCDYYRGRLFNIHPSLLPRYTNMVSMNVHQKVIDNNDNFTGCTLHQMTEKVDQGQIMWQKQIPVNGIKNPDYLKQKVQELESDLLYDFLTFYQQQKIDYKDSGVDVKEGDKFVELIKNKDIGSFCSINDFAGKAIATSTDGVGTKLELARKYNKYEGIGIDLVAMCVNDLYARGAKPEIFLDYIATSKLDKDTLLTVIDSIKRGCQISNIKLVGGETAEMPGMYRYKHFDLAGFTAGSIDTIYPRIEEIKDKQYIYALPSNGIHSNGYSLVRNLLKKHDYDIDVLMKPTKIYTECLEIMEREKDNLIAMAHITGGGLTGNIKRVIPENFKVHIDVEIKDEFKWLMIKSKSSYEEMIATFNCGYGMAFIFKDKPSYQGLEFIGYISSQ